MTAKGSGFFTLQEINRLKIIQDVLDGQMKTSRAAEHPGLTSRQCRHLLARYRFHGPLGLGCGMNGQPSNNQLMPGLAAHVLSIIRENYQAPGPTLACEKLAELHGVFLCKETVRKLMNETRLWILRRQRFPLYFKE